MLKFVSAVIVVLAMGSLAQAEESTAHAGAGPCANDVKSLCPGIEPGDGRVMKCMRDNKDKVSAECKAHHESMKGAFKEVKEACHDDVEKFCGSTKGGKGRIMKCMKEHKEELSEGCKNEIDQMKAKRKGK